MVKNFLVTRPNHDVITSYLYDFFRLSLETIKECEDMHVTDLDGVKATRELLEKTLSKEKPGLIFFNGHGDRRRVAGYKDEIILDEKNVVLAKNSIVYALACDSLETLGEIAVEKGVKAYIGYKASFMMVLDPSRSTSPNKDKNALPFKRVCNTLISSLVFGLPVGESVEKTRKEYMNLIRSYGTSEDDPYGDVPLIRFALAWNLEFLDMCGDPNASF